MFLVHAESQAPLGKSATSRPVHSIELQLEKVKAGDELVRETQILQDNSYIVSYPHLLKYFKSMRLYYTDKGRQR